MPNRNNTAYEPELADGQKVIAILEITVFDMLSKMLALFPDNDILIVEKNLIHERIGANCFVEINISEVMKINAEKNISYDGKAWNQTTLSLNLYNRDKRIKSIIATGDKVFIITDEKENALWFKNDEQEISFPWCERRAKTKTPPPKIKKNDYITEALALKSKECAEVRNQSAKSEYLDLEVNGEQIVSYCLDDESRYTLAQTAEEVDMQQVPTKLRSYHILHFPKQGYELRIAKVGDDYILHSKVDLGTTVTVNMYEYLSFI